jgi:RHS repeat-associated protein
VGVVAPPIAQVDDSTGGIQYLHEDLLGSVRLITNASGTVVSTSEYDPYGVRTGHSGGSDSAIGYSGNWTDSATGLVYLRARDYDPRTAQFLTIDPAVDSTNQPYAYVANDPLSMTDPTGLCIGLDGTPQDRPCTENDFYWAGLPGELDQSVCGGADLLTCAVQYLDPVYAIIAGSDKCAHSSDPYGCAVETFDPFYSILDGLGRLPQDIQNGCALAIAEDIAESVQGASGTLAIGLDGVVGKRAFSAPKGTTPTVTFGHGARHLAGTGLSTQEVESAILQQVNSAASQASGTTESFWGRVTVNGTTIEYRAYTLPDGTINVGTYYVP